MAEDRNTLWPVVVVRGYTELLQVVGALRPPRRLSGSLNRGKQQRDQDADNRDHYQEFHQGEAAPTRTLHDIALEYPEFDKADWTRTRKQDESANDRETAPIKNKSCS